MLIIFLPIRPAYDDKSYQRQREILRKRKKEKIKKKTNKKKTKAQTCMVSFKAVSFKQTPPPSTVHSPKDTKAKSETRSIKTNLNRSLIMYKLERLNQELLHPFEQMHAQLCFSSEHIWKGKKKRFQKEDTADTNIQTHTICFSSYTTLVASVT